MSGAPVVLLLWGIFLCTMWLIREIRGENR